jgi:hypothetical protein
MHETYPGHHTERACKEQTLVRDRGLLEETIVMVPTPQSLVAEGIAVLAAELLLDGDGAAALTSVLRDAGIELDFAHARAVERALDPLPVGGGQRRADAARARSERDPDAGVPRALGAAEA